jgi:uncharacterized repeat protein (TIGR01451 family)
VALFDPLRLPFSFCGYACLLNPPFLRGRAMRMFEFTPRRVALSIFLCWFFCLVSPSLHAQSSCPSGSFVYVNNNVDGYPNSDGVSVENSVSAFCVGTNGALTAVEGSPFATGGYGAGEGYYASNGITATVVGNFLYAADNLSNDIAAFSINPSTGALTLIGTFAYGTAEEESNPLGIALAVTPNGQFLYAVDANTGDIWGFSIAQSGPNAGALTALTPGPGVPPPLYTFPSESYPDGTNVTRDGKYLAVAVGAGLEMAMFSIQSGGTLVPVTGSPFATPATIAPSGTAYPEIDCASNQLFASIYSEGAADISVLTINGGALSPIAPPPSDFTFPSASSPDIDSNVGVLSATDNFLFVSNQLSNTIMSLAVAPGGALSAVTGSPFCNATSSENCLPTAVGSQTTVPLLMATNQAGTLLFVANSNFSNPGTDEETFLDNTVTVFSIAGNGALTLVSGGTLNSGFDTGAGGQPSLTAFPPKVCGLSVGKVADASAVSYGNGIGFTVTVSNGFSAPATATSVSVTDPLPGGAGASWQINGGSASSSCAITGAAGSQVLNCSVGNLPADTSASVHISSTTPAANTYVNTVEATPSSGSPIYSAATVTVTPGEAEETLSVTASGAGSGSVAYGDYDCSDTAGAMSGNCSESFAQGTLVTLTANTSEGSTFGGWGGACASAGTSATCTVTMSGSLSVTATFNPPVTYYTLTVLPQGLGAGTIQDPTGEIFDCSFAYPSGPSGLCQQSYASGTQVTLTLMAVPTSPSTAFGGWGSPGLCANFGTTATCTLSFTITSSQVITAGFPLPPIVTTLEFTPGSNVSQMVQYCPNNIFVNGLCTDPNASAFTVTVPTVSSAFPLTVVATELGPNGLCPASQVPLGGQSSDFACRFVSFFNYGVDPATGDTIVPLCYSYLNGDCAHYYLYSGTPGMEPPPGSFEGGLFFKIGWNNVFAPPQGSYWFSATPAPVMLDDPGVNEFPPLPYGDICTTPMLGNNGQPYPGPIYCQFDQNITTFFTPGPGLDPIGGRAPAANDLVVAFLPTTTGTNPVEQPPTPTAPTLTVSCISGCAVSGSTITFNQGTAGTFVVSATGYPAPNLTESGALPTGLTFNPTTGTITGTPAAGTGGMSYPISFTASNGVSPNATSNFTLTVSSVQLSSPVLNFGTLYLGQIAAKPITLTNTGSTPMTLSKATVTTPGNALSDYVSIDLCPPLISAMPGVLPPGKSCTLVVGIFAAQKILSPTPSTATLDLSVGGVQESVLLTAQVVNPQVSLSTISLNFKNQKTGTPSAPMEVTLTNSGSSPLTLTGLKISQPIAGNFALTSGAGTNCTTLPTLSPQGSCEIYVTFTPTSKGLKTGVVTITDDTLISTQLILLSGTGD